MDLNFLTASSLCSVAPPDTVPAGEEGARHVAPAGEGGALEVRGLGGPHTPQVGLTNQTKPNQTKPSQTESNQSKLN